MQIFNRTSPFKSSWQVLSAESAKVILPFCTFATVNFFALILNWRTDGIARYNTIHQIIAVSLCAFFLGSYDIRHKRQEFITTQAIKRSTTYLNRLCYLLVLVLICISFNALLFSGIVEETLYQEIWMYHSFHPSEYILISSAALISFSLIQTAQTLTGALLTLLYIAVLFYLPFLSETPFKDVNVWLSLTTISLLLLVSSYWEFSKMSQVRLSFKALESFTRTSILAIIVLISFATLLFISQEGAY